jgi:hypothetical protein
VANRLTVQNAFNINNGEYAEYHFSPQLQRDLGCSRNKILAVRRIQRQDKTKGYFTVVGCFDRSSVPSAASAWNTAMLGVNLLDVHPHKLKEHSISH